ncbi:hypothetical protein GCM10023403_60190 [Pseudonocardia benzenivorans]
MGVPTGSALPRTVDDVQGLSVDGCEEPLEPAPGLGPRIGGDTPEDRVPAGEAPGGQRELEASADEQVRGAGRLGQQDRVLVPHGDHRGAERDPLGVLPDRGEERQR